MVCRGAQEIGTLCKTADMRQSARVAVTGLALSADDVRKDGLKPLQRQRSFEKVLVVLRGEMGAQHDLKSPAHPKDAVSALRVLLPQHACERMRRAVQILAALARVQIELLDYCVVKQGERQLHLA